MVRGALLVVVAVVGGCGPGTPPELPVVKVSADELAKEYAADPSACRQKYDHTRVEVTGLVESVRNDDAADSVVHVRLKPATGEPLDVAFHLSQEPKLLPIVPGQTATVRGVFAPEGFRLGSGELIDPGPSPTASIAALVEEAKKDPVAFRAKYAGVRLTGKLTDIKRLSPPGANVLELELTIGDTVDDKLDRAVTCKVQASDRTDQKYRLVSLIRRSPITVVGKVVAVNPTGETVITLEHAHVIP
jgi:hypothetical protein